jgi:hypothetical protein
MHGSITVRLYYDVQNVIFVIEDTGVGIPDEGTVLRLLVSKSHLRNHPNYIPVFRHRQSFPPIPSCFSALLGWGPS